MGFLGALWYGFPSRRMTVIGVTGTKGKTTTSTMIWHILQKSGYKTGLATTVNFRIGDREIVNEHKQTMLGRFELQKLLKEMADEGCTHAVIETSSWGIAQYRHRFINYKVAALTNLSPEHIEQHGGFENYRAAKVKLFAHVGRRFDGIGVYNLDDKNIPSFLGVKMPNRFGFMFSDARFGVNTTCAGCSLMKEIIAVSQIVFEKEKSSFVAGGVKFSMPLTGQFNIANAACAIAVTRSLGIPLEKASEALASQPKVSGRMEVIQIKNKPTVIIDYAHEPASLEAIYNAASIYNPKKMIAILGSQGGGRDIWKREAMGRIAAKYLDIVILTNEDPYDDDPFQIVDDIEKGVVKARRGAVPEIYKIIDRKEAINKAIELADGEDVVLCTGKGGEVWMCIANERKLPWDERKIVEEVLATKGNNGKTGGKECKNGGQTELFHGARVRKMKKIK
jgi:UDP-N-acetylmuramoyl-L-alanyl-D-glutamate--2,6-diaminopimelate ligase